MPAVSRAQGAGCAGAQGQTGPSNNATYDTSAREDGKDGVSTHEGVTVAKVETTCEAVTSDDAVDTTQPPLLPTPSPRSLFRPLEGAPAAAASGAATHLDTESPQIRIPPRPNTGMGPVQDLGCAGSHQTHGAESVHPGSTPSGLAALSPYSVAQELTRLCPSPHFLWNPSRSPGQMLSPSDPRSSPFGAHAAPGTIVPGALSFDLPSPRATASLGWPLVAADRKGLTEEGPPSEFHGEC